MKKEFLETTNAPSDAKSKKTYVKQEESENFLPQSRSRSMDMMLQIMAIAIEQNYLFNAEDILGSVHDCDGGYFIVFCSANTNDNEELDEYSDPDFHEAASAFLSDLKGINNSKSINIYEDTLCIKVGRQIDLFNLLEEYAADDEFMLANLDDVVLAPPQELENMEQHYYRESIAVNAAKIREQCLDVLRAESLLQNVTPKAYFSKTHFEAAMGYGYAVHIPFSFDHLAKIIEQEEGTTPSFDRPRSLVLGGYQ